jgi:hypothetical protein
LVESNLPNGSHNVTVYANNTFGNMGASETINFTVDIPEPTTKPRPFPTTLVIGSVVAVTVVSLGPLVYFRKRHGDKNP